MNLAKRVWLCGSLTIVSIAGAMLSVWMMFESYEIQLKRCSRLPTEYYPELGWLLYSLPLFSAAAIGFLVSAIWDRKGWSPLVLAGLSACLLAAAIHFSLVVWSCPP